MPALNSYVKYFPEVIKFDKKGFYMTISKPKFYLELILSILICCVGLYFTFYPTLISQFNFIQTDPGDTRLNHYFLEHSYKFLFDSSYNVDKFWSPTFYWPYNNVLAFSDNLLGSAPIYWLYRLGLNPKNSFQLWMISICSLNFFCGLIFFKRLSKNIFVHLLAAFIFAFSMPIVYQLGHQQLLPQFFTPLYFLSLFSFLKNPQLITYALCLILWYLQLLAGIYLGWFLAFATLIFIIVLLSQFRTSFYFRNIFNFLKTNLIPCTSLFLGLLALTFYTLYPYIESKKVFGARSYSEVETMIPRISSWFLAPTGNFWNNLLSFLPHEKLPMIHEHYLFLGFVPYLFMFLYLKELVFYFLHRMNWFNCKNRIEVSYDFLEISRDYSSYDEAKESDKDFLKLMSLTCFLSFTVIFLISLQLPFGVSLWRIVYEIIPGASVIRAVTRICLIANFLMLTGVVIWLNDYIENRALFLNKKSILTFLSCFLFVFGVFEQYVKDLPAYDPSSIDKEVAILSDQSSKNQCGAIYVISDGDDIYNNIVTHIDSMWVGISSNIPSLNGYSGQIPPNFQSIPSMNLGKLFNWLDNFSYTNSDSDQAQLKLPLDLCIFSHLSHQYTKSPNTETQATLFPSQFSEQRLNDFVLYKIPYPQDLSYIRFWSLKSEKVINIPLTQTSRDISSGLKAEIISATLDTFLKEVIRSETEYELNFELQNTGDSYWISSASNDNSNVGTVNLGLRWYQGNICDQDTISLIDDIHSFQLIIDKRIPIQSVIEPGQVAVLNTSITSPLSSGEYSLVVDPVSEGIAWFSNLDATNLKCYKTQVTD